MRLPQHQREPHSTFSGDAARRKWERKKKKEEKFEKKLVDSSPFVFQQYVCTRSAMRSDKKYNCIFVCARILLLCADKRLAFFRSHLHFTSIFFFRFEEITFPKWFQSF